MRKASRFLSKDKRLARVVKLAGPCELLTSLMPSPFRYLMRAIVYQQLSGKAAATILGRLLVLFPTKRQVTPKHLLALSDEEIRSAGISRQKLSALRDLAEKAKEGVVPGWAKLKRMDDDEIIECLTTVRGVGRWTVQMLLMFQLGRLDVLPIDDLGVRKGFMVAYGKREMPTPKALAIFGERWSPYRSVASWYMWRAVDVGKEALASKRS